MEYLISAFWSLLELIALHYYFQSFLSPKTTKKIYILTVFCAWFLPIVYTWSGVFSSFMHFVSLGMILFVAIFNYKGSLLHKVATCVLAYVFCAIIDIAILYGASSVLAVDFAELSLSKVTYTLVCTIGKMLSILIAWLFYRIRKKRTTETLQHKWLLLTLLFPTVSFVIITTLFHEYRGQADISLGPVIICAFLLLANIAIVYLIQLMEKSASESKKLALLNQQMEIQTSSILALEQNYRAQRKATHEFQNQLQTIRSLIASGDYSNAQDYIQQLQGTQTTRIFSVSSHHPIIDAVLNHKYQLANDNDIEVRIQVNDLSGVSIDTNHMVVLLSNLFDNAIEACLRHDGERIIHCSILASDSLYISIRNTSVPVEIKNNHIQTTKEPREDHGYGLAHIDLILNHLHAEFIRSYSDGWFEFATEIPLEN